jgi:hypothetical protein
MQERTFFKQVYWLCYFSDIDVAVHSRAGRFAGRRIHICDSPVDPWNRDDRGP